METYCHHPHLNQTIQTLVRSDLPSSLRSSKNHCVSLQTPLFLHPLSRYSINLLPPLGPLVELTADPPDRSPNPSAQCAETIRFLASRIIFLITAVPSILVIELMIEKLG
ncbi:hypothetical protein PGTUg99_000683 [Puccinia graminis f. sp. tritici]|uniref:Uncharacterized protein n=1 Tax=Puccinia graminis f. sp. tritici TaxID=56615 RepID=A0A5B0RC19_PUCGR|nr:hypothetical protein PGTUg99_000683 [Puccinia graminis f. sp. tritici]